MMNIIENSTTHLQYLISEFFKTLYVYPLLVYFRHGKHTDVGQI